MPLEGRRTLETTAIPADLARLRFFLGLKIRQLDEFLALSFKGTGTPEGVVVAPIGSIFQRTDGGAITTLYVKESGTGNTGWVAK